jgi:ATP-dependent DNA helicase RecQ
VSGLLVQLSRALEKNDPRELRPFSKPLVPNSFEYPIWRLQKSWIEESGFGLDEAVLVRQALRWANGFLPIPYVSDPIRSALSVVDVWNDEGRLYCHPFLPTWLDLSGIAPEDGIDYPPVVRVPDETIPGEAYISDSFGYTHWKSQALKEACWQAFEAPSGATVLIALPTGSGKSLCFHFLARFSTGLTLVVVPTVALAIDQFLAARKLPSLANLDVRYFAADDPGVNPNEVIESVRSGSTRLLFTSPEACVSGRLRPVLDELASQGRLDHVVIDEAHMVGTWGIFFRVDFQLLSTLWQNWRKRSRQSIRTFLLSATFTPDCREGLKTLFPSEIWLEFVSQRLRPEISYYLKRFESEEERSQAVSDCVRHLPRPAILYTTTVKDAKTWRDGLLKQGFRRIGCFTGETKQELRRSLLDRWRADEIDVMVATSAFGLGVDKSDVRTVLHACVPEDLDRFYQEVGRSGRDGYSAISALLATSKDERIATQLGPTLLLPETIQQRWQSLWRTRQCIDENRHRYMVNVRSKKEQLIGTRTYDENVRWNKRLLLQLLRAGKLILLDLKHEWTDNEEYEWITLELKFPPESPDISSLIGLVRQHEMEKLERGLEGMLRVVDGQERICTVLHKLYGRQTVIACGGCPGCRREQRTHSVFVPLRLPPQETSNPEVQVVLNLPSLVSRNESPSLVRWLRRAWQVKKINRFVCTKRFQPIVFASCREAFGGDPSPYRIDFLTEDRPAWEPPFCLNSTDNVIALHGDRVHRGIFEVSHGHIITHWICEGCDPFDERGKRWADKKGVRPYVSPEIWIAAGGDNVH